MFMIAIYSFIKSRTYHIPITTYLMHSMLMLFQNNSQFCFCAHWNQLFMLVCTLPNFYNTCMCKRCTFFLLLFHTSFVFTIVKKLVAILLQLFLFPTTCFSSHTNYKLKLNNWLEAKHLQLKNVICKWKIKRESAVDSAPCHPKMPLSNVDCWFYLPIHAIKYNLWISE